MRDKIAETVVKLLLWNKTGNEIADAILALEVDGKIIDCPDTGRLMICMDCENKNDPTKCNRTATIGDLLV